MSEETLGQSSGQSVSGTAVSITDCISIADINRHNANLRARQYYEKNKSKVLSRQKVYRAKEIASKPWIYRFNNARALAIKGDYMGSKMSRNEVLLCRDLYRRALELNGKVTMIVSSKDGGKFEYRNLQIVGTDGGNSNIV